MELKQKKCAWAKSENSIEMKSHLKLCWQLNFKKNANMSAINSLRSTGVDEPSTPPIDPCSCLAPLSVG